MAGAVDRAQRTVDAIFRQHGVPANYIPPAGPAQACTVVVSDEDRALQFGGGTSRPVAEGGRFEIRKREVAVPASRGVIALLDAAGAEIARHVIVADPLFDDAFRLVWVCTVRPTVLP